MTEHNNTPAESSAPALSVVAGSVFEMLDHTDDETYYTLGVFLTLEEAKKELDACKDPTELGSDGCIEDCAVVEIRERKLGWSGMGKTVFSRSWSTKYDEAKDEYEWIVTSETPTPNPRHEPRPLG